MTTPEATDPLIRTAPVERGTVVGRYELVGVNGALLPVPLDPADWGTEVAGCSVISGEVRLTSGEEQSSAAVAGVSLVHRRRPPERHPGSQAHWVYIRR